MFKSQILTILTLLLFLGLSGPTIRAQETDTKAAQKENSEAARKEKLENDISEIGLSAGYAAQCHMQKGDQEAVERVGDEALAVAGIILQDFGSNLAFLFASNAGYGTGKPLDDFTKCDQLIADWQEFVEHLAKEQEEGQL
ncbi:MAG: hypothetical protein AB4426_07655 [Xenococcaceae cyanobacterium]